MVALCVAAAPARVWADEDDDSDIDINDIVDELLDLAKTEITDEGLDTVYLPDITEKFKKKVSFIHITGKFQATDGWAKSLASIERTGDASLTEDSSNSDRIIVEVPLSLSDLQVGYNYKAKLGKLGPSGTLSATVSSNAVTLRASLLLTDDACSLSVDSLSLDDLGKINVHATGLGKLNFLYSKIVTWVTSKLHDKIENAVQNALKKAISNAGLQIDCSSFFS